MNAEEKTSVLPSSTGYQKKDMPIVALRLRNDMYNLLDKLKNDGIFFRVIAKSPEWIRLRNNDILINASKSGALLYNVKLGASKRTEMGKAIGVIEEKFDDFAQRMIDLGVENEPKIASLFCSILDRFCSESGDKTFFIFHSPGIFVYHFDNAPINYIPVIKKVFPNTLGASPDSIISFAIKREKILEGEASDDMDRYQREFQVRNAVVEYKYRASGKEFPHPMDLAYFVQVLTQMKTTGFEFGIYIAQKPEDGNNFLYQCRLFKSNADIMAQLDKTLSETYEHIVRYYHNCEKRTAWERKNTEVYDIYEKMLVLAYDGYDLGEFVKELLRLIPQRLLIKVPKPVPFEKVKVPYTPSSSSSPVIQSSIEFTDVIIETSEDSPVHETPVEAVITNSKKRESIQEPKAARAKRSRKRT